MKLWAKKDRARGWTGVDSGPEGIFGVSVRPPATSGGKPQVVKCASMPETEPSPDVLSRLSRKLSVAGLPWALSLDRSDYSIMVIPEPPVLPSEMEQSVRWSLGTLIKYPAEEANIAWMSIPTKGHLPNRQTHIYVIAARSEIVLHRAEPFRRAKLPLQALDVRETTQRNIAALLEKPGEGLGLVVLSNQGVAITFTFEGELFLDRFIKEPLAAILASDDEGREKVFDRITLQLQRSIAFINRTLPFMTIGRIVLAPLPSPLALREHLARNIAEPVEMLDLDTLFDLSLTPELLAEKSQARYFSALGAALRGMGKAS
ncbi:MAG: hypothetical protein ABIT34_00730 [Gammaproteobacteria bacterium]